MYRIYYLPLHLQHFNGKFKQKLLKFQEEYEMVKYEKSIGGDWDFYNFF